MKYFVRHRQNKRAHVLIIVWYNCTRDSLPFLSLPCFRSRLTISESGSHCASIELACLVRVFSSFLFVILLCVYSACIPLVCAQRNEWSVTEAIEIKLHSKNLTDIAKKSSSFSELFIHCRQLHWIHFIPRHISTVFLFRPAHRNYINPVSPYIERNVVHQLLREFALMPFFEETVFFIGRQLQETKHLGTGRNGLKTVPPRDRVFSPVDKVLAELNRSLLRWTPRSVKSYAP